MTKQSRSKRRRRRFRRQTPPGAAPGIVHPDPESPKPTVYATVYSTDALVTQTVTNPDKIANLRTPDSTLWVDVHGLGDARVLEQIARIFDLHPLAMEDVVHVHQQIKVEDYDNHLFVVTRSVNSTSTGETLQISMFVGDGFVITFQERATDHLSAVHRRLEDSRSQFRRSGADFLAYGVLDVVIDGYFPLLEHFGQRLDDLEEVIADKASDGAAQELHSIRRSLGAVRRYIWQHREALNTLLRDSTETFTDSTRMYLRDCYDHTVQLGDLLEIYRETCSDLRDVHLSTISNRMNETMMVLTVMASIFIPLSFIASLYGMNFDPAASPWNMPELSWYLGYPFVIGLMIVIAVGLLIYFRRQGWIGRQLE